MNANAGLSRPEAGNQIRTWLIESQGVIQAAWFKPARVTSPFSDFDVLISPELSAPSLSAIHGDLEDLLGEFPNACFLRFGTSSIFNKIGPGKYEPYIILDVVFVGPEARPNIYWGLDQPGMLRRMLDSAEHLYGDRPRSRDSPEDDFGQHVVLEYLRSNLNLLARIASIADDQSYTINVIRASKLILRKCHFLLTTSRSVPDDPPSEQELKDWLEDLSWGAQPVLRALGGENLSVDEAERSLDSLIQITSDVIGDHFDGR